MEPATEAMEPIGASYDPAKTPTTSRRSRTSDDAAIQEFMRAIQAGEIEATEPDTEPVPVCPICEGRGFVRHVVPPEHPDFGRAFSCECMTLALAQRRLERIFGAADVPAKLARLSFATFASIDGDQGARVRVERWAADGEGSLYLHGKVGRGKTGLAYAAFRQRLESRQCDGLFRSSPVLLDAIRSSFDREIGGPTTSEVADATRATTLLFLDDIGAEKPTAWVVEQIEKLVDYRYLHELATVFTSNLDLGALASQLSQRVASRIKDMCGDDVLEVAGRDQRIGKRG